MSPAKQESGKIPIQVGIDIGGTFTDFVIHDPQNGAITTFKLPSTPDDPAQAVIAGLTQLSSTLENPDGVCFHIVHGSTVATNALLERKGVPTALVTTLGFKDLLQIGRQHRSELYQLAPNPPEALVPALWRLEVNERVDHTGKVIVALDENEAEPFIPYFNQQGVISVAVCLLFSFLHPEHEQVIASRLRQAGFFVSLSSEILPEYREYERCTTTVANAYVSPVLDRYLSHLEKSLPSSETHRLQVMQSNGGMISISEARRNGARCILSGPAGGLVGALFIAQQVAQDSLQKQGIFSNNSGSLSGKEGIQVITFDMGGTSTDVSLLHDGLPMSSESHVGGIPIRIPVLDIHTIGAGGGSVAVFDAGGALRVGPQSAGADPGPACYGRGDLPTVTDAHLVLGRLLPEFFLGGAVPLNTDAALKVISRLGKPHGLDPYQTAAGMIEVANAHMERALRVISVERGHDPRYCTLLSFGGAGGLHASDLARRLGIPVLLIPPLASTLSAFGMLAADVIKDYTRTVMIAGNTPAAEINALLHPIISQGIQDLVEEGVPPADILVSPSLDMRYQGQSYELAVPWKDLSGDPTQDFHALHRSTYGYARPNAPIEIVNLRVRVTGEVHHPKLPWFAPGDGDPRRSLIKIHPLLVAGSIEKVPFFLGESLMPGDKLTGPVVIVRQDTTIWLNPGDQGSVDRYQNLVVSVKT